MAGPLKRFEETNNAHSRATSFAKTGNRKGYTKGVTLGLRFSLSPRNAISKAGAAIIPYG